MFLKIFYFILLILSLKSIYCHNYKKFIYSNILRNNFDLEELKKTILENGGVYEFGEESNKSQKVSYKQIVDIEKEFDNYETHRNKETVRHFYLFTSDYHDGLKYEVLDPLDIFSIKSSHFKTRRTFIIIHGFLGNGLEAWILSLKDKLLQSIDCNVISVDWPAGYKWFLPTYVSAAGRVPYVGNDTAFLMQTLIDHKGLLLESVHCIGHSLGAHVCGFAGKPFLGRVGRISGLDPAGPQFHNVKSSSRLDKSDAIYVDVIHTNACNKSVFEMDCFGLDENIGHSNFFPNGGQHQPACTRSHKAITGDIGCDHEMAYMYYIASLNFSRSTTYFLARPCEDWLLYEVGNCSCGKNAQYMGFEVNTELEGLFFLDTFAVSPFAKEDSGCSPYKEFNYYILIGYVIVAAFVGCCVFSVLILVVENIKRTCCSSPIDEENPLVSSDEDSEDEEDTPEEGEEDTAEEGEVKNEQSVSILPHGDNHPSVISA